MDISIKNLINRDKKVFEELYEVRKHQKEAQEFKDSGHLELMEVLFDKVKYSSFYKKIKSITGLSVMEFINDYRIFKAVQLFKDGETNVTNVAEKCGFNDASSFRAAFKNKMGMSPKQYVQRL